MNQNTVKFELEGQDFICLMLMLGYATAAAMKHSKELGYSFLDLANRINRDNPNYTPYQIPEEFRMRFP